MKKLPEGFCYLRDVLQYAQYEIRYATSDNFTGRALDGYLRPVAISSVELAQKLKKVEEELYRCGYILKIFDCYRPARAVMDILQWANDEQQQEKKEEYYPDLTKQEIIQKKYIAPISVHSMGGAIDLTLAAKRTGKEVDMCGKFDFFGVNSAPKAEGISFVGASNRKILYDAMMRQGFCQSPREWWHFALEQSPFAQPQDFPVE